MAYEDLPPLVIQAFLAAEDDRFFQHPGVDYHGLLRAAFELIRTGHKSQGGSTITMQVARNFFLSREKTFTRKLKEIFLALKINRELTKQEILDLYLNKIYLGNRAYGVGAAARIYYGKNLDRLSLAQIAMIAGLPKAPSRDNPVADPRRARSRRGYVLGRMLALGYINRQTYERAMAEPVTAGLHTLTVGVHAPYAAELVRAEMVDRYGPQAYTAGYRVYTTLNARLQRDADRALRDGLLAYDRRHGDRGPVRRIDPALLREPARLDRILADVPATGARASSRRSGNAPPSSIWGRVAATCSTGTPCPGRGAISTWTAPARGPSAPRTCSPRETSSTSTAAQGTGGWRSRPPCRAPSSRWTRTTGRSAPWSAASTTTEANSTAWSRPSASRDRASNPSSTRRRCTRITPPRA